MQNAGSIRYSIQWSEARYILAGYLEIPKYNIRKKRFWNGPPPHLQGWVKPDVRLTKVIRILNHNDDYGNSISCKVQTLTIRQLRVYKKGKQRIHNACWTEWGKVYRPPTHLFGFAYWYGKRRRFKSHNSIQISIGWEPIIDA